MLGRCVTCGVYLVLQDGHEDEERHLRQLMDLMHHEDSCSDEEAEGHARLMALAAQVATQRGPSQPISQAVRPSPLRHLCQSVKATMPANHFVG